MTFVITQPCIDVQDQSCVEVCPVDCIHFEEGEDRMLYIDPVSCIDCGACEPACPVDAIYDEADVPEEQARFTAINELWYSDRAAARAQAAGGAPAPAAPAGAEAEAPAPAEAPAEAEAEAPAAEAEAEAPAAEAGADEAEAGEAEEPADGVAEAETEPAVAAAAAAAPAHVQVEATYPHGEGPVVSRYRLPSPLSLGALVVLAAALAAIFLAPGERVGGGPDWDLLGDLEGPSIVGLAVAAALAPLALLAFAIGQYRDMRLFAAKHGRGEASWREAGSPWRRSEESRRFELETAVRQLARDRFPYPNEENPDYRTYTNLPSPTLALEFTAGGASAAQVFPDIVVVEHPRNRPIIVAQVETRETVTRRQAELVWAPLENVEAPLYIYVPAGLVGQARDHALAAGIRNARFRSWRRQPDGMLVREV